MSPLVLTITTTLILSLLCRSNSFQTPSKSLPLQYLKSVTSTTVSSSNPTSSQQDQGAQEEAQRKNEQVEDDDVRIYFDIALADNEAEELGRLTFNLGPESKFPLPLHAENIMKLCSQERRSIDPKCSYIRCKFKHSPQFVEGFPQYRWAQILDGTNRRNAVRTPNERIEEPESMRSCTHSMYGGCYYGHRYENTPAVDCEGVVLTVPLVGAFRGSTSFSIVRVKESPQEWGENLLLNSAVLGGLESGMDVLLAMARQTRAPPIIVGSGKIY